MITIRKGGLVVSCQARADNPLHGPAHMAAMALAAEQAGVVALRANGPDDVRAIRAATTLPVVGINKVFSDAPVYITPTGASAKAVMAAGAQIVALDCTERERGTSERWQDILGLIHQAGCLAFADVSTLEEGVRAADAGADFVATTLSGYVGPVANTPPEPDFDLVTALSHAIAAPVIAEGRVRTPAQAAMALDAGAHAVVVGTMITNPRTIARTFVEAMSAQGRAE